MLSQGGGGSEVGAKVEDTSRAFSADQSALLVWVVADFKSSDITCWFFYESSDIDTYWHKPGPTGGNQRLKRWQCATVKSTVPSILHSVWHQQRLLATDGPDTVVWRVPAEAEGADSCTSLSPSRRSEPLEAGGLVAALARVHVAVRSIELGVCVSDSVQFHLPDCNQGHVILRTVYFSRAASDLPPREPPPPHTGSFCSRLFNFTIFQQIARNIYLFRQGLYNVWWPYFCTSLNWHRSYSMKHIKFYSFLFFISIFRTLNPYQARI